MGMRAQIRAQSGASGTQKVQPPALIRSHAKMGRYRCDKKAIENGESYRPGPQNQQLNNQVNEAATIFIWKVKCLKGVGEERLSAQRRVEPQCESHSSQ
jgi:hypothetical protein